MLAVLLAFVQATTLVSGAPAPCKYVLKETFSPAKEWVKQGAAPQDHEFTLRLSFAQPSFDVLEEHLYAVSDPDSARYGEHFSIEDTHALMAPSPDALAVVNDWLVSHGFDIHDLQRSPAMDWVKLNATVQKVEEMLNTTYHVWKHSVTGDSVVRTTSWSLPDFIADHIDLVHPTTMFAGGLKPRATTYLMNDDPPVLPDTLVAPTEISAAVDPSCNTTITPSCLLQLYNAVGYSPRAPEKGNIAIASYLEEFANIADLTAFFTRFVPAAVNSSFEVVSINGGENNQTLSQAGGEANLDTQYAFGLSFPIPATVFTTGGRPPFTPDRRTTTNTNEPYLDFVDFLLAEKKLPNTISTSYGDDEQTVPLSFAQNVCGKFAILGLRGVTLTFSSGDGGVGDNNSNPNTTTCISNDGLNTTVFLPEFPASCPFVTAVGGTVNVPERAVTRFGSGGGFSNYFKRPLFQFPAVPEFLAANANTNKGLFNPQGRGIPDVAAQGDGFAVILRGATRSIGGTSAASPTFAGIVALLNDARLAVGKRPLGFLNPLIYRFPKAFNDITVGSNPGCGTLGFSCREGWDAVTGLGTPNFKLLKDIVLKL